MVSDNYERREDINPCDDCKWRMYSDKCLTCKHKGTFKLRPRFPNTTDGSGKVITSRMK